MLISKEVELTLSTKTIKYYEKLGYKIPREKDNWGRTRFVIGTKIKVKVEDLTDKSSALVEIKCDNPNCKNPYLKPMRWVNYKLYVHENEKYYCNECAHKLYGGENARKTKLTKSKSFEQWCTDNGMKDILDRWDYELNDKKPSEISYSTSKKYYFKCPRNLHKSECNRISDFTKGSMGTARCNQCNSFAQWGIDNLGEDFLEKYWDYKVNTANPWKINFGSVEKVWIKCQYKNYHNSYEVPINNFTNSNSRCPYCNLKGKMVHELDSLGTVYPQVLEIWSNKNKESYYNYAPKSSKKVWWKCPNEKHDNYYRSIYESFEANFNCPSCIQERDESFLQEKVRVYLENLEYTILHEFNCTIVPQNPKTKKGHFPFDNEVKELKLIIEVHGIQHYKVNGWHILQSKRKNTTPEYELHMQQVRDRYKKFIAYKQGYNYIAIPYWTDDKNETWKQIINNKINKILGGEKTYGDRVYKI